MSLFHLYLLCIDVFREMCCETGEEKINLLLFTVVQNEMYSILSSALGFCTQPPVQNSHDDTSLTSENFIVYHKMKPVK